MSGDRGGKLHIRSEGDIILVRRTLREAAGSLGFGVTDVTRIVTAGSELARNIVAYAGAGIMRWWVREAEGRIGIELDFEDKGPGIPDVEEAMRAGFSSSGGLGMGLPGTRRLMDDMRVESAAGKGTTVKAIKWLQR